MSKFQVALILINYNGFDDTKACLKSIRLTDSLLPFVIVIDNASPQQADLESLSEIYPEFKLIRNKENIGFGKANNQGIHWALDNGFEYIFLLNNDTVIEPATIRKLTESFSENPDTGMTTCKIVYYDKSDIVWYGGGDINYKRGKQRTADFGKNASANGADKSRYVTFASGCAMMFKADILKKLGGFDNRFFMYAEDIEMCMRLANANYKIWYTAGTTIRHKVHASSNKNDNLAALDPRNPNLDFYIYHMTKNLLLTMQTYLTGWRWFRFLTGYFSIMAYKNVLYIMHGRLSPTKSFLKAVKDFIKEK